MGEKIIGVVYNQINCVMENRRGRETGKCLIMIGCEGSRGSRG